MHCLMSSGGSVADPSKPHLTGGASVAFLKLELLCHKHFPCIGTGKGTGSVSVVLFDVEHDLIN